MTRGQRTFAGLLATLVVGLVVHRLVTSQARGDRIVVGVLAPFGSTPGEGIRNGVAMAVAEINSAGGVLGRPLAVVEVDTAFSVEGNVRGYQALAGSHGAAAVVGCADDGIFAVMEQLAAYRVPLLGTGVGADRLTAMVAEAPAQFRWYFRLMHSSGELGQVTSAFVRDLLHGRLGMRRFAVLCESGAWTDAIRRSWEETIRGLAGAELVLSESFSSETRDFAPVFTRIRQARAEYVLDASSRVEATHYLVQWADLQGPPIGAIPTGAGTRRYHERIGERGLSVCSVSTIPSEVNQVTPRSTAWWRAYLERYGDPEYTSGYSYDAVYVLKAAIEAAGGTEPDALVAALERTDFAGVAARWCFDASHHPRYGEGYRTIPMIQYHAPGPYGYRIVWPAERAQGDFVRPRW